MKRGRFCSSLVLRSFITCVMIFSITLCNCAEVRAETVPVVVISVPVSLSRGGSVSNLSGTVSGNDSFTVNPNAGTTGSWRISGYNTDSVQVGQTTSARTTYTLHTRLQYQLSIPALQRDHMYQINFGYTNGNPSPSAPSGGSVSLLSRQFFLTFSGQEFPVASNSSFIISSSVGGTAFFWVECDWSVTTPTGTSEIDTYDLSYQFLNMSIDAVDLGYYSEDVVGAVNSVNGSIQQTTGAIQQGNQLQQEANDLQEEANETGKGILGQITDFFGSFFENVINSVKSLFIPEEGYFSDFFERLNDLFADKLGMLYVPIDLFIQLLTSVSGAGGADPGIPFPGVKWEDTWLIEPQTVSLSAYAEQLPGLQEKRIRENEKFKKSKNKEIFFY